MPSPTPDSAHEQATVAGDRPWTSGRVVDLSLLIAEELPCFWSSHMPYQQKTFLYRERDIAFHERIWQLSQNSRLQRIARDLEGHMRLSHSVSVKLPGRAQASLDEHLNVIDAITKGDAIRAEVAARIHIESLMAAFGEHCIGAVGV